MKIVNNKIQKVLKTYKSHRVDTKEIKSSRLEKAGQLNISSEAKDVQIAMKALKNIPDIREEKVGKIKEQIKAGTYKADANKIVEKMIENLTLEEKI